MEPITLHFNEEEYNYKLKKAEGLKEKFTSILKQVSDINGLTWTAELFKDFITGSGNKAEAVIAKTAIQPLIKANISSQTLLDEAANGDKEKYRKLYQAVKKTQTLNAAEGVDMDFFTVDQRGEVIIPETAKELLREQNTTTIRTENGKALYDAQTQLIEICNTILELCGSQNGLMVIDETTNPGYVFPGKFDLTFFEYDHLTTQQ